jgi:hypothetical protein
MDAGPLDLSPTTRFERTPREAENLAISLSLLKINKKTRSAQASAATSDQHFTIPEDLRILDDSPLLRPPQDVVTNLTIDLNSSNQELFDDALKNNEAHGRVVMIRLHQLVKFSPAAIAKRIFGGLIQEIQLFERKRMAIIVFLYAKEASEFIRHMEEIRSNGDRHDIVELQIEADWYQYVCFEFASIIRKTLLTDNARGGEQHAIISLQEAILAINITMNATRALRLHRIPMHKTKQDVSEELGGGLEMMLIAVVLCTPHQRYLRASHGRQAVIEFASIKDAVEARDALQRGKVVDYEHSEPDFVLDPSESSGLEKRYCDCMGCKERRKLRCSS